MDTVLKNIEVELEETNDLPVSCWIKENSAIRPSYELNLISKIEPGLYIVDVSQQDGLHCKKVDTCTDELFLFKDNKVITKLSSEINKFWDKKELYKENKLIHKRGILLEGYPGTGKTSIISLLSQKVIDDKGIVIKITSPKNLFYYTTFVKDFFRKIEPETPIITIIEDINEYMDVSLELLDLLDGKNNIDHNLIIATSNDTSEIDDTFLRPSRLDLRIEIELPNDETRREYLLNKGVPEEQVGKLVDESKELSLADLKELYICIYILDYSIEEAVNKIKNQIEKKDYTEKDNKKSNFTI